MHSPNGTGKCQLAPETLGSSLRQEIGMEKENPMGVERSNEESGKRGVGELT
jgi:hypothetical protein